MNKAIRKRIKFTKTGKALRRIQGQNHFNAKQSRKAQMRKKRSVGFGTKVERNIRQYASNTIK